MGFILTTEGVKIDPLRVSTIMDWPLPKSFRDIQVFLGFANFYRRFIREFSRIVRGLTAMLKGSSKDKFQGMNFHLTEDAESSFHQLFLAFTTAPMLCHFDPLLFICVETNALGFAISEILSQQHPETGQRHPVAFWSRKKTTAEINYGIGESEILTIVEACKQWRHYIEGSIHRVTVITHHGNLQRFLIDKSPNCREAQWWERLSGLNLSIEYRPGRLNPADAPFRRPDYEDYANCLEKKTWIKQDFSSDIASLTFLTSSDNIRGKKIDKKPWVLMILGNENNQGNIIAHTTLQKAASRESAYEEISLTIQTAIWALQEVDPLVIRRRAAIKKSNEICIMSADKTRTHQGAGNLKQPNVVDDSSSTTNVKLGVGDLKQPNVLDDSDLPLSSLSSSEDMADPE